MSELSETAPSVSAVSPPLASLRLERWLAVAALTFAVGQADRLFHHRETTYGTLLLAPGCLLPLFLWWGGRYWTAAACGAVATLLLLPGIRTTAAQWSWISIPALALGFAVELGLTMKLLRQWHFRDNLSRGKDALLLVYAALWGTTVSGWLVMPVIYWPECGTWSELVETSGTWWLLNFVSIVIFTPAWLSWRSWKTGARRDWPALAVMVAILIVVELIAFRLWTPRWPIMPLYFAGLPMVVWGVLRYGLRAAVVIVITVAVIASYGAAQGVGPFVEATPMSTNYHLNLFLLAMGLTFNLVGSFSEENRGNVQRLQIEHALLAKAEEIAGVGSWQYDVFTQEERWSQQFFRQLGLLPNEIKPDITVFCERFVVPEERRRFAEDWESFVRTGQPNRVEFRVRRDDGRERIFVGQADVQRDPDGRPIRYVGTLRDVTERRRAVEDRQRMQELLNKAEELANLGSWEMDGTGFIPRWSDNMHRIAGIEREFTGSLESFVERFVHPDDRAGLLKSFAEFARGNGQEWAEFRLVRPDGRIRNVIAQAQVVRKENGQVVRCFGTTTDVTDRKESERMLRENEQRYRLLADNASDMIARIREDGTIGYISPACRKILDVPPQEMLGRPMAEFIDLDDRPHYRRVMQALFAGETRPAMTYRGRKANGEAVWLETKAQLLTDERGVRELLCVTRDITERRALEEQVAQAQRLEAIGRLAGGIAHDFNNILTVINGYAEILETRFPADDPASKFVANILEAGRRAADLTRQLLTYSRKQLVKRGAIDLNEILRKLEPLLKPLMGEAIELVIETDPSLGVIEGDAAQFEQLVMNLAINARDAMPAGGRLTLETAAVRLAPEANRPAKLAPGRYARLIVSDTGEGMDEIVRSRLFEPFFTTKDVGHGTGLGLATVHATVEQCGGSIAVDSELGQGTKFELHFPVRAGAVSPSAAVPAARAPAADIAGRRILVVEDDPHVRSLVELTLRKANLHVAAATSGDEALALAKSADEPFDLLLTDVVMQGMNGRELADSLRLREPNLAVIFMSGHTDDIVVRRGVLHDEVPFLHKPFTAEELMHRVQHVLAGQAV